MSIILFQKDISQALESKDFHKADSYCIHCLQSTYCAAFASRLTLGE